MQLFVLRHLTHHQRRSNPQEYEYNVGCLEGINSFDLGDVPTSDGVNHLAETLRDWRYAAVTLRMRDHSNSLNNSFHAGL